jgi:succinate dehydrogenase / fumarate reductase iron-sulfur subunit
LAKVTIKALRRDSAGGPSRWEEFEVGYRPGMNVIILLNEIRANPVTTSGTRTTPVAWECSCLEEVCGACAMVINGKPMQACSALVDKLRQPITLEPLSKFPVVRDLMVDRGVMFENLKRMKAWIPIDGTYALGPGPRMSPSEQQRAYPLSRCITCGCCIEACPQANESSPFVGAAILNQVLLMNSHPTGRMNMDERLAEARKKGGLGDCGNAQNCKRVCPKEIPLVDSISRLNRQAIFNGVLKWLGR